MYIFYCPEDKAFENGTEQAAKRLEPRGESRPSSRSREDVRSIDHHGLREDSPRRVDFSKTHQLREVNWDGTYQDSLAYPADIHGTSATNSNNTTNSRDLRETDIHFLNFSHVPGSTVLVEGAASSSSSALPAYAAVPGGSRTSLSTSPYAPPPSVSNSVTNCNLLFLPSSPPSSSSSSSFTYTSSSSSPPVTHHRPAPQQHTHQSPDVRWSGGADRKVARSGPFTSTRVFGKTSSGSKGIGPRLAHVDLQPAGSARTGSTSPHSPGPSLAELKRRELLQLRKHVEEKWTSSNNIISVRDVNRQRPGGNDPHLNSEAMDARVAESVHHRRGEEVEAARLNRLETIPGDAPGVKPVSPAEGAVGGSDLMTNSPKRPLPIKMPITADLKEDGK
ncbi:hypothetical protein Btru_050255 [Bulinus truncatus]|nr:hypothetical protein Btru_050255 [Bulinus truncatus]